MEACGGAHHLDRLLGDDGFEVRLMSPEYVRPYVKAQKNDDRDAEAVAEAATRPTMRFVELKSAEQLDIACLESNISFAAMLAICAPLARWPPGSTKITTRFIAPLTARA